jgi:hypothetical protein
LAGVTWPWTDDLGCLRTSASIVPISYSLSYEREIVAERERERNREGERERAE